jgi:hypothetical protein
MRKHCTNADIVTYALKGESAITTSGAFKSHANPTYQNLPSRFYGSWNHPHMVAALHALHQHGRIEHTLESYATTVAFKIDGQWVVIDDSYSVTTNGKHLTHCYRLNPVYVPRDASLEEIDRVVAGLTVYIRGFGKVGSYTAA